MCVLSAANTSGVASQILAGDNAVIIVPRSVLAPGTYSVAANTSARNVNWTFSVDPSAATGVVAPVPVALAHSSATGFAPLSPARIVDTRSSIGATRLAAGSITRIQITGHGGVPAGAKALLANVTVTGPDGPGFLTMWNCSASQPEVSTLNFSTNETVANAATVPLDVSGRLCAFSNVSADLLIDVGGYYATAATGRYMPVAPARLMDSRQGLGTPARLAAGQVVELPVVGIAGIPTDATAVALNVTGVVPSTDSYITVFPCGALPVDIEPQPGCRQGHPEHGDGSGVGQRHGLLLRQHRHRPGGRRGRLRLGHLPPTSSPQVRPSASPTPATATAPRSTPARTAHASQPARPWSCKSPECVECPPTPRRSPPT